MTAASISPQASPLPVITSNDRFGFTLFIAVVLHSLIILGISFSQPDRIKPPEKLPGLEITLVQSKVDKEIENADFLAQANQEGGGNSDEKARPTSQVAPVVASGDTTEMNEPVPETIIPQSQESATVEVLAVSEADKKVLSKKNKVEVPSDQRSMTPVQLLSRQKEMAKLSAEIDVSRKVYANRPRKAYISARTKEYRFATYEEAWRKLIERIGTLNFPDEARRTKLAGDLRMSVTIRANGAVKEIKITKYSGHKILDDAAVRIVKMAAPFPAFGEAIRKDFDEMVIVRTWQFLRNNRLKTKR